MDLDAELDRLYGLPLDEFVDARTELARSLRADGDREAAQRAQKLRKPTVGAWALNQALRIRRSERDELLAAGERLRAAHEAVAAGAGDAGELREAIAEERRLAGVLSDVAEVIATEAGRAGPALKERVRATLHAAAVDDEVRAEVASARVVKEREGGGLGPFALVAPAAAPGGRRAAARKPSEDAGSGTGSTDTSAAGRRSSRGAARPGKTAGGTADKRAAAEAKRAEAAQRKEAAAAQRAAEAERRRRVRLAEQAVAAAHGALTEAKATAQAAAEAVDDAKEALAAAQAAEKAARQTERERARELAKRERELDKLEG